GYTGGAQPGGASRMEPGAGQSDDLGRPCRRVAPQTLTRLRRVPPCEPPCDDEAGWRDADIPGQLALDWSPAALAQAGIEAPSGTATGGANRTDAMSTTAKDRNGL